MCKQNLHKMKNLATKTIVTVAVILASFTAVKAQTYNDSNIGYEQQPAQSAYQDQQTQPVQQQYTQSNQYNNQPQGYYYYPSANVYYNPACNNYSYYNGGAWLTVNVLPFALAGPRVVVYHTGPQVWLDNNIHRNYYANYGYRPTVIAYRGGGYYAGGYRGGAYYGGYHGGGYHGGYAGGGYHGGGYHGGGYRGGGSFHH